MMQSSTTDGLYIWVMRHLERLTGAVVGLGFVVLGAIVALGDVHPLCVNGHPAKRQAAVTYGGLPPKHGFERDHRIPLGLGGPDIADNVWYQQCDRFAHFRCVKGDAADKDDDEAAAIEAMCGGKITAEAARALPQFQRGYWRGDGGTHF